MTRTWSWGSHRLRRCTDVLYIPSSALLVDDRHIIGCAQAWCTRADLARNGPVDAYGDVARGPARRNLQRGNAVKADRAAQPAQRGSRYQVPAERRLVAARERLEEARQLARELALRGLVGTRLRCAWKRGRGRRGKPRRLA